MYNQSLSFYLLLFAILVHGGGGGGGTILYKPYKYVPPKRPVRFLGLFGMTTGILFAHFGLVGYSFRRSYGRVSTYLPFQFQIRNKNEILKYTNSQCI